ncbi:cytochrome ubiquinol oxidase subunit I [Usitatibacter palustris]|uniref:Cytochrome bd-I ubiquinol oxidase subunit 1 n=1 Tax=Usitatibacter palustris TaxID=2732487 RepID=A0A6M4H3R8_9PROT|nr:cytochrome ubiquinol oxidase subunit I [Usitatibacter palustris]QJR13985.1 Cytochrome bd-I ubiquinol oxidase subunit 1 [Usitatibacter palustris]
MEEALVLARAQFGLNIAFHILFPTLTIALAWFLLGFRIQYQRTRDPALLLTYKLWTKVFALTFAMGVVTGIVMSFQFGTNWPGFMKHVGAIAGPLLGYEVLTAFFLEATFLGVMLFGMNRVPDWLHITATALVALGTSLSAFWILALNSWMQTPTGHIFADGQWIAGSWIDVIFNPSFPYRFFHMMLASGLTASFVIAGLSSWRLLKAPKDTSARKTLRAGIVVAAILAPIQAFVGDQHGLNTLKHQPAKVAAMEALWHTEKGAPLVLFAIPNQKTRTNDYAIELPYGAALILTHDKHGELKGLNEFGDDIPPVAPVFFAFRAMVGLGVLMLALAWFGVWMSRRERVVPRWLLWTFAGFTFSGWIATLCGWIVTEMGRQPWLVQGILRTSQAVGEITGAQLGASITLYVLTYIGMFIAYMIVLTHLAGEGAGNLPPDPVAAAMPVARAAE